MVKNDPFHKLAIRETISLYFTLRNIVILGAQLLRKKSDLVNWPLWPQGRAYE